MFVIVKVERSVTVYRNALVKTAARPPKKIVQGRARGVSSGAGAADDDRSRRYMSNKISGESKITKNKKRKSRWMRFDGESARECEERMEVALIQDLEEAYEGQYPGKKDNGRIDL